jgi:hypothetical protein
LLVAKRELRTVAMMVITWAEKSVYLMELQMVVTMASM